jgi:hypothetical protein
MDQISPFLFRSQGKLNKVGNHTCKYLPDPVLGTPMEQLSSFPSDHREH